MLTLCVGVGVGVYRHRKRTTVNECHHGAGTDWLPCRYALDVGNRTAVAFPAGSGNIPVTTLFCLVHPHALKALFIFSRFAARQPAESRSVPGARAVPKYGR